jgi:hypothetical protein
MSIARQGLSKHVPVAKNMHTAIEELLEAVFSVQSILKLYRGTYNLMDSVGEDQQQFTRPDIWTRAIRQ